MTAYHDLTGASEPPLAPVPADGAAAPSARPSTPSPTPVIGVGGPQERPSASTHLRQRDAEGPQTRTGDPQAGAQEVSGPGAALQGKNAGPLASRPRVIGVDLSLTSTGLAHWPGQLDGVPYLDRLKPPKGMAGLQRLQWIRARIEECGARAGLAVIEGPSYASPGQYVHERAGLWWLVYEGLARYGVPIAIAAPKGRAKYATGNGNASKDEVLAAAIRRYPDVPITSNDVADAWLLAAMGLDHLGHPPADVPKTHREALAKVAWPEVTP